VIGRGLTGPIGLIVKFSTLQEYGVDKVFVLENGNTDSSQRNIVYLVHGEKAVHVQAVAGMYFFIVEYSAGTNKETTQTRPYSV
jgi:vacuolar protein sorting-associated protein 33A